MKFSDLTEAERARVAVAFHEAAHAVQVVLAGGRVTRCALTDDPDTPGFTEYIDVPEYAERGVTYAGCYGEARWRFGRNPALADIRAVLAGQDDHAELVAAGGGLPREIEPGLETCWSAVSSLAASLIRDGEIGHRAVLDVLGWRGHELTASLVRSKLWTAPASM